MSDKTATTCICWHEEMHHATYESAPRKCNQDGCLCFTFTEPTQTYSVTAVEFALGTQHSYICATEADKVHTAIESAKGSSGHPDTDSHRVDRIPLVDNNAEKSSLDGARSGEGFVFQRDCAVCRCKGGTQTCEDCGPAPQSAGEPTNGESFKTYIWRDRLRFVAFAHARSVTHARELLEAEGAYGDASTPIRQEMGKFVREHTPEIFYRDVAEAILTDSGELEDLELAYERVQKELKDLKGAMAAQDERELQAAQRLGMVHTCDWPDEVAEEVLYLRAQLAALSLPIGEEEGEK